MTLQDIYSRYFEYSFVLTNWVSGTDLMNEFLSTIESRVSSLRKIHYWKKKNVILPKPTLSSAEIFTFWAHETIIDRVLKLPGVRGGFRVKKDITSLPDSSTYKGKKQSPRPRRVLLDVGSDTQSVIQYLKKFGLEVEQLWTHVMDLIHYEIIEICTSQYIDILVTTNPRLLMPPEEWIDYFLPHRTRIIVVPEEIKKTPAEFANSIFKHAHSKRKFKTQNHQYCSLLNSNQEGI
jgi:hypothetical protein